MLFAAVSALWAPALPLALSRIFLWICLAGVFVLVASRPGGPDEVVWPLAASGLLTAVSVLLAQHGVSVPPPIPTGMAVDAGAHGVFDHAVFAGAFLALVVPLSLYLAALRAGQLPG